MRKNAPRKWLHAVLDLLPVILIPVFMIYSHRHTIDSGSIVVAQNEVVDFNQLTKPIDDVTVSFSNDITTFTAVADNNNGNRRISDNIPYVRGHKIYLKAEIISFSGSFTTFALNFNFDNSWVNYTLSSNVSQFTDNYMIVSNDNATSSCLQRWMVYGVFETGFTLNARLQSFDLTQMFGVGNEPTIEQFNQWYSDEYYNFTLSHKELLKGISTITYDDFDIMSQLMYQLYNSIDKYFNMNNIFNMGSLYDWFVLNVFSGNAPLIMYIVWNIALYELVMDLMFLLYALFMWFIDWCKSLIERTYDVGRGK